MMKDTYIKPAFYAHYLPRLRNCAVRMGYNLLIHGSMNRDMDLVAVPWRDDPEEEIRLIESLEYCLNGTICQGENKYMHSYLPGGRSSYVINILRSQSLNNYEDAEFYLDISVTPLRKL